MNKKIAAVILLFMALVGLTIAGSISAAPNTAPNPFAPQPFWQWKTIDQGSKYFQNNWRNPWDDQKLTYKTYKWQNNNWRNSNWRNSNDHVKIYMQLFNKTRTSSVQSNSARSWRGNNVQSWRWTLNKSTIKSLDKQNRFWLQINTVTYNSTGNLTSNTTRTVFTRYDAVKYYWRYKDFLIRR